VVDSARVEQRTDLDKLTLRIWTDGSISPQAALAEAVKILKAHFDFFAPVAASAPEAPGAEVEKPAGEERMGLDELGLSTRVLHNLKEEGIHTVDDLLALSLRDLKKIPGIGERSVEEILEALAERGLSLKE
jgi:DNA-directed RNA polymerase subunit alpha